MFVGSSYKAGATVIQVISKGYIDQVFEDKSEQKVKKELIQHSPSLLWLIKIIKKDLAKLHTSS